MYIKLICKCTSLKFLKGSKIYYMYITIYCNSWPTIKRNRMKYVNIKVYYLKLEIL